MKESELQAWFEERFADETLHEYITNVEYFHKLRAILEQRPLEAERQTRSWMRQASFPLRALCNSDKILANQSMHTEGEPQKRPDFLLQNENGAYTLVELKTNRQAERQGIQELLAYTAELHQQIPFLVGVFLVMVARDWSDSLTKASKGGLLTGARLLPLKVIGDFEAGITLEINLDVLQAPTPTAIYAPHALTPYVLARATTPLDNTRRIAWELRNLAHQVHNTCRMVAQTGFVCVWHGQPHPIGPDKIIGITLFSADPNWMFGDRPWETQEIAEQAFNAQPAFMRRVLQNADSKPYSMNPSFEIMERISKNIQKRLQLEWGTDGENFEGYISSVHHGYNFWKTLIFLPFGTMQDFWKAKQYTYSESDPFDAHQLEQLVIEFNQYHAGLYGENKADKKTQLSP